jgi:hypothetical protein
MLFAEGAEHARKNVLRHGHGGADAQRSGRLSAHAIEGSLCFLGEASAFAGVAQEHPSCFGETDAAFAAVEEGGAEFFFEGVDLLADGRLAEVEALGGAAETRLFGNGTKHPEAEILHAGILWTGLVFALQPGNSHGAPQFRWVEELPASLSHLSGLYYFKNSICKQLWGIRMSIATCFRAHWN